MTVCATLQLPHSFVRAVKPAFKDGDPQGFLVFPCGQLKPKLRFLRFLVKVGLGLGALFARKMAQIRTRTYKK
jgi:hypothetical protein